MTLLARVAGHLEGQRVPFAVIGASAMAAHGVTRSTLDIDLLITDPRALNATFWTLDHVVVDLRRGDDDDPLAGVVRLKANGERDVDVVIGRAAWQSALLSQTLQIELEETRVPVVDATGLILLKLYAGGTQDAWDIAQLLAAGDRAGLVGGVDRLVRELPPAARAIWHELRAAGGA